MPKALEDLRKKISANLKGKTNPKTKKPYSTSEIWAIAQTQFKKKEVKYCSQKIQIKEDEENFFVRGLVATTHPDRAEEDGFDGDILAKSAVMKIVDSINNKYLPEAGAVSERHDYIKNQDMDTPLAGVSIEQAKLVELENNEWGAHVGTVLARTNPRYSDVKQNIEDGVYPGFSIEYDNPKFTPIQKEGKNFRYITDLDLMGFGYASRRNIANPHAEVTDFGYKEIPILQKIKQEGDLKMKIKEDKKEEAPVEEAPKEEKKEETPKEEAKDVPKDVNDESDGAQKEVSAERLAKLEAFELKETKETEAKAMKEKVDIAVKEVLKDAGPTFNLGARLEKAIAFKEVKEHPYNKVQAQFKELDEKTVTSHKERDSKHKQLVDMSYKEAARAFNDATKAGVPIVANSGVKTAQEWGEIKEYQPDCDGSNIQLKETRLSNIQVKANAGLETDSNLAHASWTYGSYYQSPVELNDIYGQSLVNQLNDKTVTWGRLEKVNFSGRSQIQFRARTGRNTTAGGYSEGVNLVYGTNFSGNVGRDKFQQPYSYYRVLVAVTGQEMAFTKAPGGMGDIWADEIKWSTADLLKTLNAAVIGTGAGTSESISLGFETLMAGTGGTLYGKSVATYTTLKSHQENTSGTITLDQLRKMIEYCTAGDGSSLTNSNARVSDLVFFTSPRQGRLLKRVFQTLQRTIPLSARIGYEGMTDVDTVPVFEDPAMNTNDWFCVDTANTKIGVNLGPVVEALPVTADAKAGHIKIYFNLYSTAPTNNYWADGFDTS